MRNLENYELQDFIEMHGCEVRDKMLNGDFSSSKLGSRQIENGIEYAYAVYYVDGWTGETTAVALSQITTVEGSYNQDEFVIYGAIELNDNDIEYHYRKVVDNLKKIFEESCYR